MYGVDDVERGTHITDGVRPSLPLRSPYCPTVRWWNEQTRFAPFVFSLLLLSKLWKPSEKRRVTA
jgi:hypothetical protein